MKTSILCAAMVAIAVVSFSGVASSDRALSPDELYELKRLNPQLAFAEWSIRHRLDDMYAAVTFQEVGERGNFELGGRKYVFAILHVPSNKIILVLEEGKLEMGLNPYPAGGSGRQALFSIGSDYVEKRRVEFSFALDPPKILSAKELAPRPADPDMP